MDSVRRIVWAGAVVMLALCAWTCGPEFPPYYLAFSNEKLVLRLPPTFLGPPREAPKHVLSADYWDTTLEADVKQLTEALGGSASPALLDAYMSARKAARAPFEARLAARSMYYRPTPAHEDTLATPPSPESLQGIPREFLLYLRGTDAYYRQQYAHAIARWSQLLALPESERKYRSTWATFMIGKAYLFVDPRSSIAFFAETRSLAAAGYPDPLDLSRASVGWQANAEDRLGHRFEAARLYAMRGDFLSQERTITQAFIEPGTDPRFFQDPFIRPHALRIFEQGGFDGATSQRVFHVATEAAPEWVAGTPGRLAHRLYRQGDFDGALKWVAMARPDDPNARWVHSKLLLRSGDTEEGIQILQDLVKLFPTFVAHMHRREAVVGEVAANPLCSDLGVLLLGREDFVGALDILARGGYFSDAAYVAERVLTVQELLGYLAAHANDPILNARQNPEHDLPRMTAYDYLRFVCARRLAREGKWADAIKHYPDTAVTPLPRYGRKTASTPVVTVAERITQLQKPEPDRISRGLAAKERAFLMREHGMELMGTEGGPDWGSTGGAFVTYLANRYPPERVRDLRRSDAVDSALSASAKEIRRFTESAPAPDRPLHYRYHAVDAMWEAAKLLPDNDPRTAEALWYGGRWAQNLEGQDPDKFYKALVRRCRKLPIGKQADELRWFPRNPKWTE